jgi:hypothetical protein
MIVTNEKRAPLAKGSAFKLKTKQKSNLNQYSKIRIERKPVNALKRHGIYNSLLLILQNKQIRDKASAQTLPYVLHPLTKEALLNEGYSALKIQRLEDSIIRDMENSRDCEVVFDAPLALSRQVDSETILHTRAVAVPGKILNALVCQAMLKIIPENELLQIPGFIKIFDLDEDGMRISGVRLDIDERLARGGFMMPVIQNGLICALKVFRYPNDEKPFILRTRRFSQGGINKW